MADTSSGKLSKNQRRRQKKKLQKGVENGAQSNHTSHSAETEMDQDAAPEQEIEVEYVSADLISDDADPALKQFQDIFAKFAKPEELTKPKEKAAKEPEEEDANELVGTTDAEDSAQEGDQKPEKKSRKKKRLESRLSVAELKQLVVRPDVVEAHDVTAADPRLLVYLKAYRNTVPVPRHWCHKRKYLQGKRGIEKPPFQLPDFIADTGIARVRESIMEAENAKKAKQKARDRMAPKMGKIDLDYQVLHDAFFKFQKKPKLSIHGDLYYEGKEFEVDMKEKKPGILSEALKEALNMTDNSPPPWLINMQRYGPPPSYPNLKIPGLNAPIPEGASFGYHPGGWGKPPVDEYGRPLYGDVFGVLPRDDQQGEAVDRTLWGELAEESEEEYEEEEEEEEPEEPEGELDEAELQAGMQTPSLLDEGMASMTSGLATPDEINLRKRAGLETPDTTGVATEPRELYRVIEQKQASVGAGLFGTDKQYVLRKDDVQVAINPDELAHLSEEELRERYEQEIEERQGKISKFDDALTEEQRKRKRTIDKASEKAKKHKDFKF